jgi:membrane protein
MEHDSDADRDAEPGRAVSGEPATAGPSRITRARDAASLLTVRLDSTVVGRLWSRLLEIEFVDRSVALAAKAFVSFFPLLILVAALSPDQYRTEIVESLTNRFGITGPAFEAIRQSFASPDQTRTASGILGALITLAFAVSFTTALQRAYLRAWRRPPGGGARNKGRGAIWVAGVIAMLLILTLIRNLLEGNAGQVAAWTLGLAATTGLWWWTARLMTRGEVRWRPLLPTAVVTGLGSWLYTLSATIWMPRTLASQFEQFGSFGVGLAFVTWFTGLAFVIITAAAIAPALCEGDDTLAQWLRGGRPTALEPGAAPALPGPDRPMRLSDALGRGGRT